MLNTQKGMIHKPRNRFHNALLTLNFLNTNEKETTAVERQWIVEKNYRIKSADLL